MKKEIVKGARAQAGTAKKAAPKTQKTTKTKTSPKAADATTPEVATQTTQTDLETVVFAVMKDTNNLAALNLHGLLPDLQKEFSEKQIREMSAGFESLALGNFIYCGDKAKLEGMIEKNGWNPPPMTEAEVITDAAIESQTEDETAPVELSYEIEGEDTIEELPDVGEVEPESEIDLTDPNQVIYDAFADKDSEFTKSLSAKETKLLFELIEDKKVFASLNATDNKLWTSVVGKFSPSESGTEGGNADAEDGQEPLETFRTPESLALRDTDAIQVLIEPENDAPLTEDETTKLTELETTVETAKQSFENAPFVMAEALAEIRKGKLYRATHEFFKDYATERFGITREWAQKLAQGGDFRHVLAEISETSLHLAGTVNTTIEWMVDTNKLAEQIGIGKSEFEIMKPIMENVAQIVADISTDANGNVTAAAPQVFSAVSDIIREIVKSGMVTIEGKQMTIEDAKAAGILGLAVKSEIVETVAEQILTQKAQIMDYYAKRNQDRTKPHEAVKPKPKSKVPVFSGVVPRYKMICTAHKELNDNYVKDVFNAGFQLMCGCKYQKLTTSGEEFVCIETDNLVVQYD